MNYIHPTAIIYPGVQLGDNIFIGAYSVIGAPPEHPDEVDPRKEWDGYSVMIGDNVTIREHVTVNAGITEFTWIDTGAYLMCHSHVGHDCYIGVLCVLHSGAVIGGHTYIWGLSRIGLNASVHPKSNIEEGSMIGAQSFYKGRMTAEDRHKIWVGSPAKDIGPNQRLLDKLNKK